MSLPYFSMFSMSCELEYLYDCLGFCCTLLEDLPYAVNFVAKLYM